MPRIFINLEAGCLQVNLMSTRTQINQLKYTILLEEQPQSTRRLNWTLPTSATSRRRRRYQHRGSLSRTNRIISMRRSRRSLTTSYRSGMKRWDAEETGRFYHELQPTVRYRLKHHHKLRKKDVILTRLRMNQTRLAAGLYKINIGDSANCAICRVPETVKHWILDCPNQRYLQHCLSAECMRTNQPFNIKTVLTADRCTVMIYEWVVESNTSI